jgi:GT2 family glycosyltransferase/glycosyltransferase involved in cell wall biosynthesis
MKILVVVHGFPPAALGGTEIYAHAHARALRALGDDVVVLTRDHDTARADYDVRDEQRDGLRIVSVNNTFRHTRSFEDTYRNGAIDAIASRLIDDVEPDVAHIHHLTGLSTTIVQALAARAIPRILTLHDYWLICHRGQLLDTDDQICDGPEPDGCHACLGVSGATGAVGYTGAAAVRALERRLPAVPARLLRGAAEQMAEMAASRANSGDRARARLAHMRQVCDAVTHFLAPSRFMRDRFVRFGVAPDRITVAQNGVDHGAFGHGARTPSPRLRLGFVGSLMMSKAPHVLLEAAGRLPAGTATVDLFGSYAAYHGDDSYRLRLEPLLAQNGVRAHGPVAHERVIEALSSIDVLVVPSIWPENSPLVIQEAFLAGVPVVASRIGGIPEMVEHDRSGLLFEPGDAGDLGDALQRLLREPFLLASLRSGIPSVRDIDDDVRLARGVYRQHIAPRSTATTRTAAVVLNYRTPGDTLLAVTSLLASRIPFDEIIVVNNDRVEGLQDALRDVWTKIAYIHTGSNLGFSGGMNVGIRVALAHGAARILLANSDVFVPPDCLARLHKSLDAAPHAGIAGPAVLARSEPGQVASLGMSYEPRTGRMRHRGYGTRFDAVPHADRIVDGVAGCLMLVNRDVFDAIGLLDEAYFFSFEDLDFCLRARLAGFATIVAPAAAVYHEGSESIGRDSPRRLYFAARNHLLLARRHAPSEGSLQFFARAAAILGLNLAHAVRSSGASLPARLAAVVRGTRDYAAGRFGADTAETAARQD